MFSANTACVNQINDDSETEVEEGTVPITFSIKIKNPTTKVINNAFEKDDQIGLMATTSSNSIKGKRYIDNLSLTYAESGNLVPKKTVFYPEGDVPLNFISYYPYQENGIPAGSSTLHVSVQADQSNDKNRSLSDFLVAQAQGITSKEETVPLEFQHKLAKLTINLIPDGGSTAEELMKANPRITAAGLRTAADYNLEDGTFSNLRDEKCILASGKWSINKEKGNELIGKEFIIIPQKIGSEEQSFFLDWSGHIYSCKIPSMEIGSNRECAISISAMQSDNDILSCFAGSIKEWENATPVETDNKETYAAIHVPALSFLQTNIYKVYHNGMPVAEVCREYLKSPSLTSRAITAYPTTQDGKADLSNGIILQLLDCDDAICGGKISWNPDDYGFTYDEGKSTSIGKFYIDEEYHLSLSKPAHALNINVASQSLLDTRATNIEKYPITKIGKQYWMGKELRATAYRDGTALKKQTQLGKDNAGYYQPTEKRIYFYNGEAILAGELAPEGWRLPTDEDWNQLKAYIGNDVSVLKTGEWEIMIPENKDKGIAPINNYAYFNAFPVGMWYNGEHNSPLKMTAFWSWDAQKNTLSENAFYLLGEENEFVPNNSHVNNKDYYKALSIRCIKE